MEMKNLFTFNHEAGMPMKPFRIFLIIALSSLLNTNVYSQNFAKIIEIVGNLEDSMTVRFANEATIRSSEIAAVKTDLAAIKKILVNGDQSTVADRLNSAASESQGIISRIEALERKSAEPGATADGTRLSALLDQLVAEFKKVIDDEKKAQQKPAVAPSPIQISGTLFSYFVYSSEGKEGKDFNRFDLDRLYLTAKGPVFEGGKIQVTTDLYRAASYRQPDSIAKLYYGGFAIRMKFAFMDFAPFSFLSVKFGLIPTVWPSFVDGVWKYRGISGSVSDLQSYYPTADIGVSASYALPGKMGDISGFILNGNGFTSAETNRYKDFAIRANVYPFIDDPLLKPLLLAAYVLKGSNISTTSSALPRNRFGALLSYTYSFASATVEYNSRQDAPKYADTLLYGSALSFFGEVKAPVDEWKEKCSLVWRFDVVEPNDKKGGDVTRLKILGLVYKPFDKLILSIDRQWIDAETKSMKPWDWDIVLKNTINKDDRWFFHVIVNF